MDGFVFVDPGCLSVVLQIADVLAGELELFADIGFGFSEQKSAVTDWL